MLRPEELVVNHKKTYRLESEQGLLVRKKKKHYKLPRRDRVATRGPDRPMLRWSLD